MVVGENCKNLFAAFTTFRISGMMEASMRNPLIKIFRNQMVLFPRTLSLRQTGRHVLRIFSANGFYKNSKHPSDGMSSLIVMH